MCICACGVRVRVCAYSFVFQLTSNNKSWIRHPILARAYDGGRQCVRRVWPRPIPRLGATFEIDLKHVKHKTKNKSYLTSFYLGFCFKMSRREENEKTWTDSITGARPIRSLKSAEGWWWWWWWW